MMRAAKEVPGVASAQLDLHADDAPERLGAMLGGRADAVLSDMPASAFRVARMRSYWRS
jgi:23S rRNA U2552 (ribose-2'-O)-methylase RlmE/FtsJ